jgi:EmrB/QacA subfamily drug resistance transporter
MTVVVLGSGMAFLDSTIVNVAIPAIGREFHASTSSLQWVLSGYLLTLASLILLGGSLGDRLGRRRVFVVGTAIFTIASLLCAIAPTIETLIGARLVQGVGGALLTPGSLAIIEATFRRQDRPRAIGAWSGLTGVSTAVGPLLGGYLITAVSWRAAFLINIPIGAVVLLTARHVPETRDPDARGKLDISGATLVALALAGSTYALIEAPDRGMSTGVLIAGVGALAALAGFVETERKSANPMVPLDIFTRQFTAANLVTFVVYAALSGVFFLLVAFLQISMGYSAIAAGAASLPVTVLMLFLAGPSGELAQRIGPRLPLAVGPLIIAAGLLLMTQIEPADGYLTSVFPAVVVFGFGLVLVVSPVTATVLAAAPERRSGIASGVNNAVSRVASLLAIAVLPVIAGLTGHRFYVPHFMTHGFHVAMLACAGLAAAGGILAWLTIDNDVLKADAAPTGDGQAPAREFSCPVAGPPLRPGPEKVADGHGPAARDSLAAR